MFLRGIAIYGVNENGKCELIRSSEEAADPTYPRFFSFADKPDYLQTLEESALFRFHEKHDTGVAYHQEAGDYKFYAKKMNINILALPENLHCYIDIMITFAATQKMFEDDELSRLMRNIQCVFIGQLERKVKQGARKVTLADIVANPLEFVVQDKLQLQIREDVKNDPKIKAVNKELAEVKKVMLQNIELVLERGEALQVLEEQTKKLESSARLFSESAKSVNQSCVGKCTGYFSNK